MLKVPREELSPLVLTVSSLRPQTHLTRRFDEDQTGSVLEIFPSLTAWAWRDVSPGGRLTSAWPPAETALDWCSLPPSPTHCVLFWGGISSAFPFSRFKESPANKSGSRGGGGRVLSLRWGCRHRALRTLFVWTGSFSVSCVWEVKGWAGGQRKALSSRRLKWFWLDWCVYTCRKLASDCSAERMWNRLMKSQMTAAEITEKTQ